MKNETEKTELNDKQLEQVNGGARAATSDIGAKPAKTIIAELQAKAEGVDMQTAEARPGAEMLIRVRGGASLTASNESLCIVDGVATGNDQEE